MEAVDQDAGYRHASEECHTLGDLPVLAQRGSTAVVVPRIGKRGRSRPDGRANCQSVPQRISIAAYLTDVVDAKLLRRSVYGQPQ